MILYGLDMDAHKYQASTVHNYKLQQNDEHTLFTSASCDN